jgi:hypothetical protein
VASSTLSEATPEAVNAVIEVHKCTSKDPLTTLRAVNTANVLLVHLGAQLTRVLNGDNDAQYALLVDVLKPHCGNSADTTKQYLGYLYQQQFDYLGPRFMDTALQPCKNAAVSTLEVGTSLEWRGVPPAPPPGPVPSYVARLVRVVATVVVGGCLGGSGGRHVGGRR